MKKIECLVWSNDLNRGEQGNALIARFLEKACNLIEAEINEALKDGFISDDEAKKIEELRKQLNLSEEHSKSLIGLLSEKK